MTSGASSISSRRVPDIAEGDEAEYREADQEREGPEQERRVTDLGAVVPNALRLLLLLHRLRDGREEFLVRLRLRKPL